MIYEITDKCFFSQKEKQLNRCSPFLLPPLLLILLPPSSPLPFLSSSGIRLSVAQLSRACEVENKLFSITGQNEKLLGCSGWFFSSPRSWKAARVPVNQTHTQKSKSIQPWLYGAQYLWRSFSSGLLFPYGRRWEMNE